MNRRKVEVTEVAGIITKALQNGGVYLNSRDGEKINSMVIGWGHVGRIWNRPCFMAYVRACRYTRELLDRNPEFTVSVPVNGQMKRAFQICGTKSGRDMDKFAEAGLTAVPAEVVSVPAIREFPLTLECRVMYRQEQAAEDLPEDIRTQFYSDETEDHVVYYGQIVAAYMLED
ncbi:MAG: flavin reductase family protein [Oscillospiraceae bacterium]|nr:flavin reductase family protein [Oscillospiraceae bacterium]